MKATHITEFKCLYCENIKSVEDMHWCKQCETELLDGSRERLDLKDVCNDCYPFGNREENKCINKKGEASENK